jgi:Patatin-like phospholipase
MPGGSGPFLLSEVLEAELSALGGTAPTLDPPNLANEPNRLRQLYSRLYENHLSALCLSGGGIRSASFSLGVIQGLAEAKLLDKFNYLSTVSGGGYIGSWLSAWLYRTRDSEAVIQALRPARQEPDREPPPIRHLREYSSYLTPQVGLLSADTWAAVAIILRNIALNWLILVPAIALPVVGLKLIAALAHSGQDARSTQNMFWPVIVALLCLVFGSLAFGYKLLRLYSNPLTDAHEAQRRFLLLSVVPAMLAGACFSWLVTWGGTPTDALGMLVGPISPGIPSVPKAASLLGILVFALLVYLGANLAASVGTRPMQLLSRPSREPDRDMAAWALAVLVFGVAIWAGVQIYAAQDDSVVLYKNWCLAKGTTCAADAKPQIGQFSIGIHKEVLLVIFGTPWFLLATLLAHTTYLLLRSYSPKGDVEREWLGRASGWHFIAALLWLVLSVVVLLGPKLYFGIALLGENAGRWLAAISGASGLVTALIGKSGFTPARGSASGWKGISLNVILAIAGAVFAITMLILLSAWSDGIVLNLSPGHGACFSLGGTRVIPNGCYDAISWIELAAVLGALMLLASTFVNVNRFSLHAVYRNRLIRAYLGASRPDREPDGFTGFDWNDNFRVASLWDARPPIGKDWRPFHVINMTLNLAATRDLAWQQRKAMSFTVTPLFSGAAGLGYRRTREYGDPKEGITLGTAMAISGAAVSPNMGYHSSPAAAFLLTLFDVRLGWWLGNPGPAGERLPKYPWQRWLMRHMSADWERPLESYRQDGPWLSIRPLLSELFGLTNDDSPDVYLSDGGHFEDLGIYEMVRRRCRFIVVCDGAEDRGRAYEDLGNAVRKIWIDLGVRISFEACPLLQADKETKPLEMPYFAIGKIEYVSDGRRTPEGKILYIKPAVRGDESAADIIAYQRLNSDFPQQSTGDQWFDEPQLESYRALGYLMMSNIVRLALRPGQTGLADLDALFTGLCDPAVDPKTMWRTPPEPPLG